MEKYEVEIRTNLDEVVYRMYTNGSLVDVITKYYDEHVTSLRCDNCPAFNTCHIRVSTNGMDQNPNNCINATCASIIKEWLLRAYQ